MVELPLDGRQVREDIRVVELQVVENGGAWAVMDEFAALVEEGAVIFVGLHHEERRAAEARGNAEVLRHAADQEARTHAGLFQHPGEHAGAAGLAVGTGHGHDPAALQHMVGQPLRAADIEQALVQYIFHRRIAAAHGIADHHQIRRRLQLGRVVALDQLDTLGFQLGAHGRVDIGIGAGDAVTKFLGQHCQRTHEGAADAEDMNVHGNSRVYRARRARWPRE